jgi:fermentation-respiration switch protein FrsA (DUF1100 family)
MVTNPVALALLALYLALVGGLSAVQRDLMYFPNPNRPAAEAAGIASLREIELVTSDGLRLLAWYVPPPQDGPVVVYFHGNGGNLQNRVPRLAEFAKAGLGVLMPEYRGYGGNEGEPTETGLYSDADAAMEFVRSEGINGSRVVVYGESLGTGVATYAATQQEAPGALVLEAPYTSMTELVADKMSFVPSRVLLKDRYDSLSRIGRVRAPILILHGEQDELVPIRLGRQLFEAAPEPKEFWSAEGAGHNDLAQHGALEIAIDFIRRRIPADPMKIAVSDNGSWVPETAPGPIEQDVDCSLYAATSPIE